VSLVITSGTGYHAYRWFQSETCISCKLDTIFELDFKEYMAQFHIGSVSNSHRYFDSMYRAVSHHISLDSTIYHPFYDSYFHYLLFYSMFLPLDGAWAVGTKKHHNVDRRETFISPGTIALKLLITWLYWDAGYGKYTDPLQGWTLNAKPLPALDTYVRHTVVARIMYGLLGPTGLRYMTPTVVYAEMLCAPIGLLGSLIGSKKIVYATVIGICFIHIGIAFTMRNTVLLSLVACTAWCIFLPSGIGSALGFSTENKKRNTTPRDQASKSSIKTWFSTLIILCFGCGSLWFEVFSEQCNQSHKHIWSTLLHNRWNVFVGAEEYVTWEIAPGQLANGSIVDVWSKSAEVNWNMPGAGAPCTSTARAGRWRSFPYLAELKGEDGEVLWSYLCKQWDKENGVNEAGNEGKKLMKFNFFMLQADVLPNMGFSATRKRLIHSHDCLSSANFVEQSYGSDNNDMFDFRTGEL
jgi:hypothetical protein